MKLVDIKKNNGKTRNNKGENNYTWQSNHERIKNYILRTIEESQGNVIPTVYSIAKALDLSENTVKKHLDGIKFVSESHPLRVLTDNVIYNIYKLSKKNAKAQELWMMIMEGWVPGVNVKIQEIPPIIMKRADEFAENSD